MFGVFYKTTTCLAVIYFSVSLQNTQVTNNKKREAKTKLKAVLAAAKPVYLTFKKQLISSKINQQTWVGNMLTQLCYWLYISLVIYTLRSELLPFIDFIEQQPPQKKHVSLNPNLNAVESILSQESCFSVF